MKIAILDDYQDQVRHLPCFALLAEHEVVILNETLQDPVVLSKRLQDVEALILIRERTAINAELLNLLPNLKLISQTGKVSNHIDVAECHRFDVAVAEGVGSPVAPSELCWALIMAAARLIPQYVENLKAGVWQDNFGLGLGVKLEGKVLGIWGYGKIGRRIAHYAEVFGMQVLVWGSEASRQKAVADGYSAALSKQDFFSQSDVLSLHLRLNDTTRGCVSYDDLKALKETAIFVNTSRAELVEEGALYRAMSEVPTRRAAVDVYASEPVTHEQESLLSLANVICSPHIGYVEQSGYELYFQAAIENVLAFAKGTPMNLAK